MRSFLNAIAGLYLLDVRGACFFRRITGRRRIPERIYKTGKKLNVGSGNTPLPGYVNCDVLADRCPDIVCDVHRISCAKDGEYDLVRASHVLEHFEQKELRAMLAEWRRILKVGGYLVVCVPDSAALAWRFLLKPSGYYLDEETYKNGWINGLFALDLPPEYRHKVIFSHKTLARLLAECGFRVVGRVNYLIEEPYTIGVEDNSCTPFSLNLAAVRVA